MKPHEDTPHIIDAITHRAAQVSFVLMLLVVLIGTFNTIARSADRTLGTSLSSNAYLELQWYLFAAIFLLAGAYTLRRDAHVRVDVLYDRLGKRARAWVNLAGHLLFLLPFCAFMIYASIDPVWDSWKRREISPDPSGLPRYPIKALIPLAFVLLGLQGVSEVRKQLSLIRAPSATPEGDEPGQDEPDAPPALEPDGDPGPVPEDGGGA